MSLADFPDSPSPSTPSSHGDASDMDGVQAEQRAPQEVSAEIQHTDFASYSGPPSEHLANVLTDDGAASQGLDAAHGYDGHVALALDPGALSDIGSTLDLLTHSHDLFDVPTLDLGCVFDDASGA